MGTNSSHPNLPSGGLRAWLEAYLLNTRHPLRLAICLAALSGFLSILAFPPTQHGWAIIPALVPLILAGFYLGMRPQPTIKKQLLSGAALGATYALALYPILGFWAADVSFTVWLLWGLVMAIFYALWGAVVVITLRNWHLPLAGRFLGISTFLVHAEIAAAWWACEWIRSLITPGSDIGNCLAYSGEIVRIADVTGQLGLSALVVLIASQVGYLLLCYVLRPAQTAKFFSTALTLLILTVAMGYGHWRQQRILETPIAHRLKCITIQPHMPGVLTGTTLMQNMFTLKRLTEQALEICPDPDLLVWPESALVLALGSPFADDVLPKNLPKSCLFYTGRNESQNDSVYNCLTVLDSQYRFLCSHRKTLLMPFAEYAPFGWKGLSNFFVPASRCRNFTAGEQMAALRPRPDAPYTVIPLVCYEDCASTPARLCREAGTLQLIVDIANDGAFSHPQAAIQHFTNAAFRSIETGCPLVRCANNGFTCVSNQAELPSSKNLLSRSPFNISQVDLKNLSQTPFCVWGHYLPIGALVLTLVCFSFRLLTQRTI